MKLINRILGLPSFKEKNGETYKLCTKCKRYFPMTEEYFHRRANVKCGFDSHCIYCQKEKERKRIRVPSFDENGNLFCHKCRQYKPVEEFFVDNKRKCRNYRCPNCKSCEKERKRKEKERQYEDVGKEEFLRHLLWGVKTRCLKDRKIKYDLTVEQLVELWNKQNGMCAISGIPMTTIRGRGHMILNASIDRLIPGGDYTIDNVQLVCSHVNVMRLNLSVGELTEFCKHIVRHQKELQKQNKESQ